MAVIPVPQRIVASGRIGDPAAGDCFKCCVASVLEMAYEDVPHFVGGEWLINGEVHDHVTALRNWLRVTGWPIDAVMESYSKIIKRADIPKTRNGWLDPSEHPRNFRRGFWIASVISENFEDATHAIVMDHDKVAFDPSPSPRRTPYSYVGELYFVAPDPSKLRPAVR